MDSPLVISFSYINNIAFEGVVSNVGYDCGIILIRRVSCHMNECVLTFVFYIYCFGNPCSDYVSSLFSLDQRRCFAPIIV